MVLTVYDKIYCYWITSDIHQLLLSIININTKCQVARGFYFNPTDCQVLVPALRLTQCGILGTFCV